MRRFYLAWSMGVFGIIGTVYGAFSLIYNHNHDKPLPVYGLVLLILGIISLVLFLSLWTAQYIVKKKKAEEPVPPVEDNTAVEEAEEPAEEPKVEEEPEVEEEEEPESAEEDDSPSYHNLSYSSSSSYSASTVYVKQVGYGPLLRVEGMRILDMRTNTYYRIENNMVMLEGSGPSFEIRGNQIRSAFGSYLYELSGSNINKVFGGFYASVSGNYITLYDLSQKFEMTDSLSKKQILVVAALLFGRY